MVLLEFIKPEFPKDTFILNFGSKFHATCLYFKKLPNSDFIKVVHINTGYDLNNSSI